MNGVSYRLQAAITLIPAQPLDPLAPAEVEAGQVRPLYHGSYQADCLQIEQCKAPRKQLVSKAACRHEPSTEGVKNLLVTVILWPDTMAF